MPSRSAQLSVSVPASDEAHSKLTSAPKASTLWSLQGDLWMTFFQLLMNKSPGVPVFEGMRPWIDDLHSNLRDQEHWHWSEDLMLRVMRQEKTTLLNSTWVKNGISDCWLVCEIQLSSLGKTVAWDPLFWHSHFSRPNSQIQFNCFKAGATGNEGSITSTVNVGFSTK